MLHLHRVQLADAEWGGPAPMLTVVRMDVRVNPSALLFGAPGPAIEELRLLRPVLRLATSPSGRPNWAFAGGARGAGTRSLRLGKLHIEQGRYTLLQSAQKLELSGTIQSVDTPAGAGVRAQGRGHYAGSPVTAEAQAGSLLALASSEKSYPLRVQLRLGDTEFAASGSVLDPLRTRGLDLQLRLAGKDAARLFALFGIPLPATPPYRVEGSLHRRGAAWEVTDLRTVLGRSRLHGELQLAYAGGRPRLTGNLSSSRLDLHDLEGLIGKRPQAAEGRLIPDTALHLNRLRNADVDLRLTGRRIVTRGAPVESLETRLQLRSGVLRASPLELGIAGGTLRGAVLVDASRRLPRLKVDLRLRGAQLSRFLRESGAGIEEGAGGVRGRLQLEGSGSTVARLVADSSGKLALLMNGGRLNDFLVEMVGLDFAEMVGVKAGAEENPTPIRCAVASLPVKDGIAKLDPVVVDTQDSAITAEGTVDLHTEKLAIKVEAHPKDPSLFSARTPIEVTGSLLAPKASPKKEGLAKRAGAAAALGVILGPLAAVIPFIEPGDAENANCQALFEKASRPGPKEKESLTGGAHPRSGATRAEIYIARMAHLAFTPNLARQIACPEADIPAATAAELFERYFAAHPGVRGYLLDDQGTVRRHVVVLVDGLNLQDRRRLSDVLAADSQVFVFQALSGG